MQEKKTEEFTITSSDVGERLDVILTNRWKEKETFYSRTYFHRLIDEGCVSLNGVAVKKRVKPGVGDRVHIVFTEPPEMRATPEFVPLSILYEDEYLLVINKPAGMVVHPAAGNWSQTFVNGLLYHCEELVKETAGIEDIRPGLVHRLDKDTSGVLIGAKTIHMQQAMQKLFASRQVYKEYLAICLGVCQDGEVSAPIGRHPVHRKQMTVLETGKPAISHFKTIKSNGLLSLVQCVITTGRTHQIRVHLKTKGNPLLGDSVYGSLAKNKEYGALRQYLHAAVTRFTHPGTNRLITITAPLPEDMRYCKEKFFS